MISVKVYYVAIAYNSRIVSPTIVEKFDNETDANNYAALMSKAKRRKYIVLKQLLEIDGTLEETI